MEPVMEPSSSRRPVGRSAQLLHPVRLTTQTAPRPATRSIGSAPILIVLATASLLGSANQTPPLPASIAWGANGRRMLATGPRALRSTRQSVLPPTAQIAPSPLATSRGAPGNGTVAAIAVYGGSRRSSLRPLGFAIHTSRPNAAAVAGVRASGTSTTLLICPNSASTIVTRSGGPETTAARSPTLATSVGVPFTRTGCGVSVFGSISQTVPARVVTQTLPPQTVTAGGVAPPPTPPPGGPPPKPHSALG